MRARLLALLLALSSAPAVADDVTFAWDAAAGAVGYQLHSGPQSGNYVQALDAGPLTTITVQALDPNQRHFFAATAYDETSTSGFSNEVSWPAGALNVTVDQVCVGGEPPGGGLPDPAYWWRLNESAGSVASNSGTAGIASDGVVFADGAGNFPDWAPQESPRPGIQGALNFDNMFSLVSNSVLQRVRLDTPLSISGLSALTFAVFVKNDTSQGGVGARIFAHGSTHNTDGTFFMVGRGGDGTAIRLRMQTVSGSSATYVTANGALSGSGAVWQAVVVTADLAADGNEINVYVDDGVSPVASFAAAGTQFYDAGTNRTLIGVNPGQGPNVQTEQWYGQISNVMIWPNIALDAAARTAFMSGNF